MVSGTTSGLVGTKYVIEFFFEFQTQVAKIKKIN
jgi:hypothetical protein